MTLSVVNEYSNWFIYYIAINRLIVASSFESVLCFASPESRHDEYTRQWQSKRRC